MITAYHWDSGTSSWQTHTGWTYSGYSDPVWIGLSVYTIQNSIVSGSFSNFVCTDGGDTRADSGTYTSPVHDAGRTVTRGDLSWEETLPSGTDIELQMAFSDDEEGPWNYVGPDGTSGTKFTTLRLHVLSILSLQSLSHRRRYRHSHTRHRRTRIQRQSG